MEAELVQNLKDIGYSGPLIDHTRFNEALQEGAKSPEFTSLVSWLTYEIGSFEQLDETVHPTSSPDDASSFLLELNIFLNELGCTNTRLTADNANEKLTSIQDKEALLDYLIVELMSCKISQSRKTENQTKNMPIIESTTGRIMREMVSALGFGKPLDDITVEKFFSKIHTNVAKIVNEVPKELLSKPIFFGELNNEQWEKLNKLQNDLNEEYTIRRDMLLQRFDVTVNSFMWSTKLKDKTVELNQLYKTNRNVLKRKPDVTLAHLLSSRDDLAIIEKTSNASVRKNTRSAINSYIIGSVPDRGGRPTEHEPPPPELFNDQMKGRGSNNARGSRGRGRGGGSGEGGGGGGGRGRGSGKYRDNKFAASNFGQNFDNSSLGYGFRNQDFSFGTQVGTSHRYNSTANANYNCGNQSSSRYGGNQSGYYDQSSSGYNQNSGYGNQGKCYNQRNVGGHYQGNQNRSNRVQGGWNQDNNAGSSNYNRGDNEGRYQGQGRGRRY